MDHLEAYHKRMERNSLALSALSEELKERGCSVYTTGPNPISHLIITKGDKHVGLSFEEVPYRWCLYSSNKILEENEAITVPWNAKDLIKKMHSCDIKKMRLDCYRRKL